MLKTFIMFFKLEPPPTNKPAQNQAQPSTHPVKFQHPTILSRKNIQRTLPKEATAIPRVKETNQHI
jgi:hypothetical protein